MKLRHAWIWGSTIGLLLLLSGGLAWAQDGGNQEPSLWLPYAASDYSWKVDLLYKVIFWLTTGMFILTEGLLIAFCVLYRRRPGHKPHYTHGSNVAEITWTIIPALMLLVLAIVQIGPWNEIKKPDWAKMATESDVTVIDTLGQQFKWSFRYPGTKKQFEKDGAEDDLKLFSTAHVPFGNRVLMNLRTVDVIHSLFIPHMRVKQDTVPGLRQRIWFKPNRIQVIDLRYPAQEQTYKTTKYYQPYKLQKAEWATSPDDFEKPGGKFFDKRIALTGYAQTGELSPDDAAKGLKTPGLYEPLNPATLVRTLYRGNIEDKKKWSECDAAIGIFEIACAELCGPEHYTMRGFLTVEPTKKAYDAWLKAETLDPGEASWAWKYWRD